MIIRDYHGWIPPNAENDVHLTIGRVRRREECPVDTAEFIVGNGGPIREAVARAIHENGLEYTVKMGNAGVFVVVIE